MKHLCEANATFRAQAPALDSVKSLEAYVEWMKVCGGGGGERRGRREREGRGFFGVWMIEIFFNDNHKNNIIYDIL